MCIIVPVQIVRVLIVWVQLCGPIKMAFFVREKKLHSPVSFSPAKEAIFLLKAMIE